MDIKPYPQGGVHTMGPQPQQQRFVDLRGQGPLIEQVFGIELGLCKGFYGLVAVQGSWFSPGWCLGITP